MNDAGRYRYRAHGLLVDSFVELPLAPAPRGCGEGPDLVLRAGPEQSVPASDPPGTVLARLVDSGGRVLYSLARYGCRTVLRYPGLCEFVGDADLCDVTVHVQPGTGTGLVPVLASGALLAMHLRLRGELVLHASAVRIGAAATAFVGASGMGKSTIATVLCLDGHALVGDDILRVRMAQESGVVVFAGSTETRLREAARPLAASAPSDWLRPTADGRLAVRSPIHTGGPLPLAECVIPLPSRDCWTIGLTRLGGAKALLRLAQFPRILGWTDPAALAREFQQLADLVERVPVYEARIPWGPPFPADIADRLLDDLGRQR